MVWLLNQMNYSKRRLKKTIYHYPPKNWLNTEIVLPRVAANCSAALTVPACTCVPEAVLPDVDGWTVEDDGLKAEAVALTPPPPPAVVWPPAASLPDPAVIWLGLGSSCSWRHTGHVLWSSSQGMIQSEWKMCSHFNWRTSSSNLKSSQHTEHWSLASVNRK